MVRMAAKIVGHKKSSRPTITQEQEAIAFPGASSFVFGDHEGEDRAESGGARGSSLLLGSFDSTGVEARRMSGFMSTENLRNRASLTPCSKDEGSRTSIPALPAQEQDQHSANANSPGEATGRTLSKEEIKAQLKKKSGPDSKPLHIYRVLLKTGWTWDRARADSLGRAYNYPHQTTSYWAMYHALQDNDKLVASKEAVWYLDQAAKTILGMWSQARWYSQQGLMVGSVFKDVLADLVAVAHPLTQAVVEVMANRTLVGVTFYGSAPGRASGACSYDACTYNTGNATTDCPDPTTSRAVAVYHCVSWANNPAVVKQQQHPEDDKATSGTQAVVTKGAAAADALANLTLAAILAYLPSVPHWAYNGGCPSWGDLSNNAKWTIGVERVTGHYRTTLNAIPAMNEWLINPDDWYLLPPFIGSASLHMATIDEDGAAAMGFHLNPKILNLDPYSGDFGIGFFGHVQLQASYYVRHPVHGPLCFLCDSSDSDGGGAATQRSTAIVITPRDS
eukprot:gene5253-10386_t